MKKMVLAGLVAFFGLAANAQVYKKGDVVELKKNLSTELSWIEARIVEVDAEGKNYVVRSTDKKQFNIPFSKEDSWLRRPVQALNSSMAVQASSAPISTLDLVKEKITEEFENDFSEYDTVIVSYNTVDPQKTFTNKDVDLGKIGGEVHPYKVDLTVRLVSINKDGTQKKINWNFKRKYLLFQTKAGEYEITVVDKEENLVSSI
jgi:hypothetical protein